MVNRSDCGPRLGAGERRVLLRGRGHGSVERWCSAGRAFMPRCHRHMSRAASRVASVPAITTTAIKCKYTNPVGAALPVDLAPASTTSAVCNSWRARFACPIAGRGWERLSGPHHLRWGREAVAGRVSRLLRHRHATQALAHTASPGRRRPRSPLPRPWARKRMQTAAPDCRSVWYRPRH